MTLSPRQYEVCDLLHQGKSNKEIATVLGISEQTVKGMVMRAMDKSGIRNRAGLAVWFYKEYIEKR